MNLAEIAQKALHPVQNGPMQQCSTYKDLKKVIDLLCSLPLEQRRKVPGINPERADIIIAGAAILEVFMKELSLDAITINRARPAGRSPCRLSLAHGQLSPARGTLVPPAERAPAGAVVRDQRGACPDRHQPRALEMFDSAQDQAP